MSNNLEIVGFETVEDVAVDLLGRLEKEELDDRIAFPIFKGFVVNYLNKMFSNKKVEDLTDHDVDDIMVNVKRFINA